MKRFFKYSAVVFLFVACKKDKYQYVGERSAEAHKAYVSAKGSIDSLSKMIVNNIEIQEDLTIRHDTVALGDLRFEKLLETADSETPFNEKISSTDVLYLFNQTNLMRGGDRIDGAKYNIMAIEPANSCYIACGLYLWSSHQGEDIRKDSLGKYEFEMLRKGLSKEKELFKKAKYLVTVNDLSVVLPQITGKESFETGTLISQVKVFDIVTGKKLAQKVIVAYNTDKVQIFESWTQEIKTEFVVKDLYEERNNEVALCLGFEPIIDKRPESEKTPMFK